MPNRHLKPLAYALALVFVLLVIGTFAYQQLEGWTWAEALYFSTGTLTTVGFGDLHPTSDTSRLFTVAFMLVGISIVLYALSTLGAHLTAHRVHALESILHKGEALIPRRRSRRRR